MRSLLFVVITACVITLMGCSDATTPNDQIVVVIPKAGSIYIYDMRMTATGEADQARFDTLNVVANGLTIDGRPNVVAFMSSSDNDSLYFIYGSNGDLLARDNENVWDTIPFGSKVSRAWLDTSRFNDGTPLPLSITRSYLRTESVTVQDTALSCAVMQELGTGHVNGVGGATHTTTYWYAPALGFLVKIRSHEVDTLHAEVTELLVTQDLIQYTLIK